MHRCFLASLLALTVTATSVTDASARDIPKEPEDYAAEMSRWHFIHQRDRKAVQTVARQFPTIRAALSSNTQTLTSRERFQRANEDEGWVNSEVLATTLAAVLFTDGKYAVSKSAGKQRAAQQKETLAIVEGMIEHLRTARTGDFEDEVWATFCRHVERRAEISLASGEYDDVARDLLRAHPSLAALIAAPDARSFKEAWAPLDDRMKDATELLIAAALRSHGKVSFTASNKAPGNLAWGIMAADAGAFESAELKADALAAQPDKRDEYVQFVLQAAIKDQFSTGWGWQHAQRVTANLNRTSMETGKQHERWNKEEKPSRMQPENTCR